MDSSQTPVAARDRPAHLPALTAARFLLAASVVFYHFGASYAKTAPVWLANLIHSGFCTVSGFFVLSGFVLAHNYLDAAGSLNTSAREFWIARFARVYPAYALSLLLMLVIWGIAGSPMAPAQSAFSLLLAVAGLQAFVPGFALVLNSAAWSLSVEAFFYALFPWLVRNLRGSRPGLVVVAALTFAWAGPLLEYFAGAQSTAFIEFIRYHPLLHLPAFVLGIALQRLWLARPVRPTWALPAGGLIVLAMANSPAFSYVMLNNALLMAPFALLIVSLAGMRTLGGLRWLSEPGEASYSLYIIHLPLGTLLMPIATELAGLRPNSPVYVLVLFAICLAASFAVFRQVEEPQRRRIRRLLTGRSARTTAPHATYPQTEQAART